MILVASTLLATFCFLGTLVVQNIAIVLGYLRVLPLVWLQGSCCANSSVSPQLLAFGLLLTPPSLVMLIGPLLVGPSSSSGRRAAGAAILGGSVSRQSLTLIELLSGSSRLLSLPVRLVANACAAHIAISLLLFGWRCFLSYGSGGPGSMSTLGYMFLDIHSVRHLWFKWLPGTHQLALQWLAVTDIGFVRSQFIISTAFHLLAPLFMVGRRQQAVALELAVHSLILSS